MTTSSLAAVGFAAGGCVSRRSAGVTAPRRAPIRLAPVRVAWDRVIRTTVGLRPHRDGGFVLRADRLDGKTLIHNYGHGGAGMSISWGTGAIAADLALAHQDRRAAVIGCGVVGLTAARQLQRRGFDVTIYARALPPDVTSSMSLAGWTPVSGLIEPGRRTPAWDAQFRQAAGIAYRQLQLLAGTSSGVSWINQYEPVDEIRPPQVNTTLPNLQEGFQNGQVVLQPGEHPFPTRLAIQRTQMRIEPSIYLPALMQNPYST